VTKEKKYGKSGLFFVPDFLCGSALAVALV